jgi:tetratricopeptide (TPR) repeat protein
VDRSLVLAEAGESGLRYRMLETIREYAGEKLQESGEEEAVRNRHLACFLRWAEEAAPALHGPLPEEVLPGLDAERGNFAAALASAQAETAPPGTQLRLAAALWPYWELTGTFSEGRAQLRAALARPGSESSPERAGALLGAAMLALQQFDVEEALPLGEESLRLFRAIGDRRGAARAAFCLGRAATDRRDAALAISRIREGLQDCRHCGWIHGAALACSLLGAAAVVGGDPHGARSYFEEGLSLAESAGDAPLISASLESLGNLALAIGDYDRAGPVLDRALAIRRRLGHRHAMMVTLRQLALLARRQGDLPRALLYLEEAVALSRELGNMGQLAVNLHECGCVYYVQGAYELAERAFSECRLLFRQQHIEHPPVLNTLGSTLFHLGDPGRARTLHRESLARFQQTENAEGIAWSLERLAVVEAMAGDPQRAARLLGAASRAREPIGRPMDPWDQADWDRAVSAVQAALGSDAFAELWFEGRASGPGDSLTAL